MEADSKEFVSPNCIGDGNHVLQLIHCNSIRFNSAILLSCKFPNAPSSGEASLILAESRREAYPPFGGYFAENVGRLPTAVSAASLLPASRPHRSIRTCHSPKSPRLKHPSSSITGITLAGNCRNRCFSATTGRRQQDKRK